jgi:apolipoprotein N-acyltransferase
MIANWSVTRLGDWLADGSPRLKYAYAVLSGAVAGLALPPFDLWFLAVLGLAVSLQLLRVSCSGRQAALVGWGFGSGYFAVGLHWIVEPFIVDADRYLWMAPFALVFITTGMALFWGAAFWAAFRLSQGAKPLVSALAWAVCLGTAEVLRSYILTGFPWALISQIWVQTDMIQWIRLLGPHGLTLATLLMVGSASSAFTVSGWLNRTALLLPISLLVGGLYWISPDPQSQPIGPVIRLVQPNAPQHEKWNRDLIPMFFQRQIDFTAAATSTGRRPDLIVWPETAVSNLLENAGPAFDVIKDAANGTPVVLGIQRRNAQQFYNSMVLLDAQGELAGLYDKHHLVPFGEYIPFGSVLGKFGLHGFAAKEGGGYSAGPGPELLDLGALGRALPLICYEAVFSQNVSGAPERPDFLLQITNDAWFGGFSGPYQHLAQARMRAIEQGLPMIRVANTGISAMIDARGQIVAQLGLGEAGFIDATLPVKLPPTVYAKSGDVPIILLIALSLIALIAGKLPLSSLKNN